MKIQILRAGIYVNDSFVGAHEFNQIGKGVHHAWSFRLKRNDEFSRS